MDVPSSSTELSITTAKAQAFQKPLVMLSAVSDLHFETPGSISLLFFSLPPQPEIKGPNPTAVFVNSLNAADLWLPEKT